MKGIIVLISLSMLVGCATFTASKKAATKGQMASGALMGIGVSPLTTGVSADKIIIKNDNEGVNKYIASFKDSCELNVAIKASPLLIPLLSAIPKLLYDISVEETDKKLKALKKSSSSSYSVDFILKNGSIKKYKCLLVMRHDEKDVVSAVIGYQIKINDDFLYLDPKFIWAKNTVANTREVKDSEKEEITMMSGLSLQGLGIQKNGIPILATSGQDSKKIGKLKLGDEKVKIVENNISIGPIPLIPSSNMTIMRLSVTEIGDIGFDVDETIARNKTIKEAIGPALAEGITGYLEK